MNSMTYCSQLLETNFSTIDLHDKVEQVLLEFEETNVDYLPVLDGNQFLGIIQEEDILDFSPETEISSVQHVLIKHSVRPNDHILQALRVNSKYYLQVVPVVIETNEWEGLIDTDK
jgi:Mg/Co/Ni transporter MgtE